MTKPFLLLLDGMTGSGKTTATFLLAAQLPRTALVRMDAVKKFVSDFERGLRDNTIAKEVMFEMVRKYLELGLSVIIDQPFRDEEILRYEDLANKQSARILKFQLFADPEIAYDRVIERQKDKVGKDKVPEDRIRDNISRFQKRGHIGFKPIDTSSLEERAAAEIILKEIEKD